MDFSPLHTYAPPQYVPENTGYTYALSSSYSSSALDFESEHRLQPIFESPRMSRRRLRRPAVAYSLSEDGGGDGSHIASQAFIEPRMTRQRARMAYQAGPTFSMTVRTQASCAPAMGREVYGAPLSRNITQEQAPSHHLWGLEDGGDLKGGHTTMVQANGDVATAESQSALSNGYSGHDCSMLSERKEVLTAFSAAHMPPTRVYSRDRSQKHKSGGLRFYTSTILETAKSSATSVTSLLVQLFHVVLLKLGFGSKAYSNYYGSTNVKEILREDDRLGTNGEYFCDDCREKKELELRTAAFMHSSRSRGGTRTVWHVFSYAGYLLLHALQRTGTAGWLASKKVLSLLWLAVVSPAAGILCFLWARLYDLVTLPALLCGLLRMRALQRFLKISAFLLPLLIGLGVMFWAPAGITFVPTFTWPMVPKTEQWDNSGQIYSLPEIIDDLKIVPNNEPVTSDNRVRELEDTVAVLTQKWNLLNNQHTQILHYLQTLESRLTQLSDKTELFIGLKNVVEKYMKDQEARDYEQRIIILEDLFAQLSENVDLLTSQFTTKDDVELLLQNAERRIIQSVKYHLREKNTMPCAYLVRNIMNQHGMTSISEEQVQGIVNNALKLYSEDKMGMPDFALESSGGSIVSTRCSETYDTKTAVLSLFGIPLWYYSQSPRTVIQPDMYPGTCWAFRGSQGHLVIQLSRKIQPSGFTLEHISKSLMPEGTIESAPKDFAVYGLEDEKQDEGDLLGQYRYNQDGTPLQTFPTMVPLEKTYGLVELKIISNWGHADYTCLYRFRVHGKVAPEK